MRTVYRGIKDEIDHIPGQINSLKLYKELQSWELQTHGIGSTKPLITKLKGMITFFNMLILNGSPCNNMITKLKIVIINNNNTNWLQ